MASAGLCRIGAAATGDAACCKRDPLRHPESMRGVWKALLRLSFDNDRLGPLRYIR
jgi:hypothetical protein